MARLQVRMSGLLLVCLLVATVLGVAGCSAAKESGTGAGDSGAAFKKTWVMDTPISGDYMTDLFKEWANVIDTRSGGRLTIDVHEGGELGYKGEEHLQVIRDHSVDVIDFRPFWCGGTEPFLDVTTLPYVGSTFGNQRFQVMVSQPQMQKVLDKYDARILANYPHGGTWYWSQTPVSSIEDLKGVKVRVSSQMELDIMKAQGAQPMFIPWGDVYTSLQRGMMEGVLTSGMSACDGSFWEVLKYGCDLHLNHDAACLIVHREAWEELPGDLKAIVMEVTSDVEAKLWIAARLSETNAAATVVSHGMTVYELDTDVVHEMADRCRFIWDDWAARTGPEANEFIEAFDAVRE